MTKRHLVGILAGALVLTLAAVIAAGIAPARAQSEGRIAGVVYADKNGNGIREEGEDGVIGATIKFTTSGWETQVDSKDGGAYGIDLNPATYTVTITVAPPGYTLPTTTSRDVSIANAGDAITNVDFGVIPEGTVLPASGGPVSGPVIIVALLGVIAVGAGLVVLGQRRSSAPAA